MEREDGYTYFMPEATPPAPPAPPKPDQPKNDWARATMWMVIVGFIGINGAVVFHSCRNVPGEAIDKSGKLIEKAGKVMADVASAFNQGRISTEFTSYASSISNHSRFQFATLKQHEIFTRTEETSTGFGYVPLPAVVVEARAPVEFTYYLDFNAKWNFVLKDGVVYVHAPPIRFNKPSVDASAITYEVKKGYLKSAEALEHLKLSISSLVFLKAKENIGLVRENGRRQTTEFVETWLLKSFTDGRQYPVKVIFPDEKPPDAIRFGDTTNAPP
jgi:hypothetical protein